MPDMPESFAIGCEPAVTVNYLTDAEVLWREYVDGFGPMVVLASTLGDAALDEFRRAFTDFVRRYETPLGIAMPYEYLATADTRR